MPQAPAVHVHIWRIGDPHATQSAFDETGRPNVLFWSRVAKRDISRGDIIIPVHTQTTEIGRRVAVPGLWGVRSVEIDDKGRTLVQGMLLVFQGDYVEWTDELRDVVGRRVQAPVRASDDQVACLKAAGVMVDEARKMVSKWV